MTLWRRFCTKPFLTTVVLGLLITIGADSTEAQEPKDDGARSRQGTLIYKSITRDVEAREAAQQRAEEESLEATAAQPLVAPANDNFANAIALQGQQGSVSGTNVDATAELGEPLHANVGAFRSVWYTFVPDETGLAFFSTFESDFDTVLAVYTGPQVDDLTLVAFNDQADGTNQSRLGFLAEAGVTYHIAVDGFQGAQGNFTLDFERFELVPPDNDDFVDAIALSGQQGFVSGDNLAATAEPGEPAHAGVGAFSSVWYTFVPNQTGVTFIDTFGSDFDTVLAVYTGDSVNALTEVASNDDAEDVGGPSRVAFLAETGVTYRIAVDGFQGAQGNFVLNLQNTNQPAPVNDDFADAVALAGDTRTINGNNALATPEPGEPAHSFFGSDGNSVWYTLTSDRTQVVELRVSDPTNGDTSSAIEFPTLAVYQGTSVDALDEVAKSDDAVFDPDTFTETLPLAFLAQAGVTYRIAVDTNAPAEGTGGRFTLRFNRENRLPPDNDDFEDAIALQGARGSVTGSSLGATRQAEEFGFFDGTTRSVWYSFASDLTRIVTFDTFGSNFDTVLFVYDVPPLGEFPIALNDDANNGRQSEVAFLAESGVTYRIRVDGFNGARGDFTLNFNRTARQSPVNDNFVNARRLTGPSGIVSGLNVAATAEANEPVPSADPGFQADRSVWWRWRAPFSGDVTFTTAGSSFDTVLAIYQGTTLSDLTEIVSNDDALLPNDQVIRESLVTFEAEEGQLYHILVDSAFAFDTGTINLAFTPGNALLKRGVEPGKQPPADRDEDVGK